VADGATHFVCITRHALTDVTGGKAVFADLPENAWMLEGHMGNMVATHCGCAAGAPERAKQGDKP
jgi:hypothetical protein